MVLEAQENNYILGGGITGLIAAYYLPDYKIITEEENQSNDIFQLGPRLIYDNKYTNKLLADLFPGKVIGKVKANVGYVHEDGIVTKELSNYFLKIYTKKTREKSLPESSYISNGKNTINVLVLDNCDLFDTYYLVYKQLCKLVRQRMLFNKIIKIDVNEKEIWGDHIRYKYKHLVSTIRFDILFKILNQVYNEFWDGCLKKGKFNCSNKYFYLCSCDSKGDHILKKEFAYLYSICDNWTRKTYFKKHIVYETTEPLYSDTKKIEENSIISSVGAPKVQIKESIGIDSFEGIHLIGRYAQWDHKIKIQDIIERVLSFGKRKDTKNILLNKIEELSSIFINSNIHNNTLENIGVNFTISTNLKDFKLYEEYIDIMSLIGKEKYHKIFEIEKHHYLMLSETLKHKLIEIKYYHNEDIESTRKCVAFSTDCISMINIMARNKILYAFVHMRSSDFGNLFPVDLLNVTKSLVQIASKHKLDRVEIKFTIASLHRYIKKNEKRN